MKSLNLLQPPEESNILIEASAGTGKTFSISKLFLHEIFRGIRVPEICVVTFTVAATQELKERIREELRTAYEITRGSKSDDDVLVEMVKEFGGPDANKNLYRALREFDQSAIFTIHSFCQKIVQDNAFESGMPFDTELLTDDVHVRRSVILDFIRQRTYENQDCSILHSLLPDQDLLESLLGEALSKSELILHPEFDQNFEGYVNQLSEKMITCEALARDIEEKSEEIGLVLFPEVKIFNGQKYQLKHWSNAVPIICHHLKHVLDIKKPKDMKAIKGTEDLAHIYKFSYDRINDPETRPAKATTFPNVTHPCLVELQKVFDMMETIFDLRERATACLMSEFMEFSKDRYEQAKSRLGFQRFDDFLTKCRDGLMNSDKLLGLVREQFSVVMLDEFQDTDLVQYEIFDKIFGQSPDHRMMMIGDPKQAIYSFRGADMQTYIQAKTQADNEYTLDSNYRTNPLLIDKFNLLFANRAENSFAYPPTEMNKGISFDHVEGKANRGELVVGNDKTGISKPLLSFLWNECDDDAKDLNKENGITDSLLQCASEIAKMLESQPRIVNGDSLKPIEAGDIAVLCFTHGELSTMKKYLSHWGISAVTAKSGDVFSSDEANAIKKFIQAMIDSKDANIKSFFIKGLHYSASELNGISNDEMMEHVVRFRKYRKNWTNKGVVSTLENMLEDYKVRSRMVKGGIGERYLTNIFHLSELLGEEYKKNKNPESLLIWMSEQASLKNDTHQQRLETDTKSVRLMTVHASKGLEFPLCYCPTLWTKLFTVGLKTKVINYSREDLGPGKKVIEMVKGSQSWIDNEILYKKDRLREDLRLIYVALTRSVYYCQVSMCDFQSLNSSSLAWLFSKKECEPGKSLEDFNELKSIMQEWCEENECSFEIVPKQKATPSKLKLETQESNVKLKTKSDLIISHSDKGIASFSSLTKRQIEEGSHSISSHKDTAKPEPNTIHSFPKGAHIGECLHEIFENIVFSNDDGQKKVVEDKLKKYKLERDYFGRDVFEERSSTICKMVSDVLNTDCGGIILSELEQSQCKSELEFYYVVRKMNPHLISSVFKKYGEGLLSTEYAQRLSRHRFSTTKGFMNGHIDLTFEKDGKYYILDWKSNYLGPDDSYYVDLDEVMIQHDYILQYHIYTLALHLVLKQRVPDYDYDQHFGGCIYAFLRGMKPESKNGIYTDRPPKSLIEALESALLGDCDVA